MFFHPIIYPLIVATNQDHLVVVSQFSSLFLGKRLARRSHKDNPTLDTRLLGDGFHRFKNRWCHHKHTAPTPIWSIIHLLVLVMRKIPRISYPHVKFIAFNSPFDDRMIKKSIKELRKERNKINTHRGFLTQSNVQSIDIGKI